MKYCFIILASILMVSCKKNATKQNFPACVQSAIDSAMVYPKGYIVTEIAAYNYQNKKVYLFVPGCCDRYNDLKDENCKYLFSPSGGITGTGDGSHPNFYAEAKFIELIWKDPRP